jgi:hypothetical protein
MTGEPFARVVALTQPAPFYDTTTSTSGSGACGGQVRWSADGSVIAVARAQPDIPPRSPGPWGWPRARVQVFESNGECWQQTAEAILGAGSTSPWGDWYGSEPLAGSPDSSEFVVALSRPVADEITVLRRTDGWAPAPFDLAILTNGMTPAFGEGGWLLFAGTELPVNSHSVLRAYDPSGVRRWQQDLRPIERGLAEPDGLLSLAVAESTRVGLVAFGQHRDLQTRVVEMFSWDEEGFTVSSVAPIIYAHAPVAGIAVAVARDGSLFGFGARVGQSEIVDPTIRLIQTDGRDVPIIPEPTDSGPGWCLTPQTVAIDGRGARVAWVGGDGMGGSVANVADRDGDHFALRWTGRPSAPADGPCRTGPVNVESVALAPDGRLAVVGRTSCAAGEMWGQAFGATNVWLFE